MSAILWYVQVAAGQDVSGGHASEFADLRAELSRLTHSVEHRDHRYLKVMLTPEHATLSNLESLNDLLRRYGFEAIDEPAAR